MWFTDVCLIVTGAAPTMTTRTMTTTTSSSIFSLTPVTILPPIIPSPLITTSTFTWNTETLTLASPSSSPTTASAETPSTNTLALAIALPITLVVITSLLVLLICVLPRRWKWNTCFYRRRSGGYSPNREASLLSTLDSETKSTVPGNMEMSIIDTYAAASASWSSIPRVPEMVAVREGRERDSGGVSPWSGSESTAVASGRASAGVVPPVGDAGLFRTGTRSERRSVMFAYRPTEEGELPLEVGDEVDVLERFEDGRAFGFNRRTGQTGYFPLIYLSDTTDNDSDNESDEGTIVPPLRPPSVAAPYAPQEAAFDRPAEHWYDATIATGDSVTVWEVFEDGTGFGVVEGGDAHPHIGVLDIKRTLPFFSPLTTTSSRPISSIPRSKFSALAHPRTLIFLGGGPFVHLEAKREFCMRALASGVLGAEDRRCYVGLWGELERCTGGARGGGVKVGRGKGRRVPTDQW
ncbi:hypothetical protein HDV00_006989 [Rhizophlyctis rosea]|nr:hypothetical protein HDV00_006989 [Rhizophlyctis rosea]